MNNIFQHVALTRADDGVRFSYGNTHSFQAVEQVLLLSD
ncbi:hypothetical protein SX4_2441 [Vibrio mimicus SX-4]|nr:hypothetical protein SX4_2441 [Vibrio mimicus SX-4]